MACSTRDINYNPVHASTRHQDHITSRDPTYLLGLLEAMDSDNSDNDEFDGYVDVQEYTHSSIDVHIRDKTTDDQDISFKHSTFYSVTPVSGTPVNNCLHPRGTRRVKRRSHHTTAGPLVSSR